MFLYQYEDYSGKFIKLKRGSLPLYLISDTQQQIDNVIKKAKRSRVLETTGN